MGVVPGEECTPPTMAMARRQPMDTVDHKDTPCGPARRGRRGQTVAGVGSGREGRGQEWGFRGQGQGCRGLGRGVRHLQGRV